MLRLRAELPSLIQQPRVGFVRIVVPARRPENVDEIHRKVTMRDRYPSRRACRRADYRSNQAGNRDARAGTASPVEMRRCRGSRRKGGPEPWPSFLLHGGTQGR